MKVCVENGYTQVIILNNELGVDYLVNFLIINDSQDLNIVDKDASKIEENNNTIFTVVKGNVSLLIDCNTNMFDRLYDRYYSNYFAYFVDFVSDK